MKKANSTFLIRHPEKPMCSRRLWLALLVALLGFPLSAERNSDQIVIDIVGRAGSAAAAQPAHGFINGYRSPVSGEVLTYHSSHPDADTSLLVRSRRDILSATWETDPLPEPAPGEPYRLVWLAGIQHKETGHAFQLRINGQRWFTFRNPKGGAEDSFKVAGGEGGELTFETKMVDKFGDLFGYMFLTLPRLAFKPGEPLVLQVVGEDDNSSDWYMTFQYRFNFTPRLRPEPALVNDDGRTRQLVRLSLDNLIGGRTIEITGPAGQHVTAPLNVGANIRLLPVDPATARREIPVLFRVDGRLVDRSRVTIGPVVRREIHLLPYSHNDIGYTDLQPNIERKQWQNLEQALDLIASTREYPPEARFKWNLEVVWALDTYLRQAPQARRTALIEAARAGSLGVTALYANVLTGLATATEMSHFTEFARHFSAEHGVPITSAVVSDIPGFTWGLVPALAQSGVRYLSIAPNAADRVGHIYDLGDKPFYWVSQSGEEKVLTWVAAASYSSFHEGEIDKLGDEKILKLMRKLDETAYPYDLVQLPYTVGGDNGPPDPNLPGFVKQWNERYVSPRILISTHAQMFGAFERRYGASLRSLAGDLTPYWEDGALSSAAETELARRAASRLIQGEALWALGSPTAYPVEEYARAWRNVVLYDEHTWGAHNSVSEPDDPGVKGQWAIKRQFAVDADEQSLTLLARAIPAAPVRASTDAQADARRGAAAVTVDVYNTTSWPRTDLILIPREDSDPGDLVTDARGQTVPSQRLSTGELAVLVHDVPPMSAARLTVKPGRATPQGAAKASKGTVETSTLAISVNPDTGAIDALRWKVQDAQFVNAATKLGLNQYLYVPGRNPEHALTLANVSVRVREAGPLVASLVVEAYAPGCKRYLAEIRLVDGLDRVDIVNEIDKQAVRDKEGVHVAFPIDVPGGQLRYDVASGIVRPELDQIPGSCKNFFSVQSFVDVSNDQLGVTWAAVDTPLIEIGGITAEQPWMRTIRPSSLFYSYVMNNYWHTNYKADQEGPFVFRYALRPHAAFRPEDAARFGQEQREPLIAAVADPAGRPLSPLFRLEPPEVLASSVTPIDGGRSWLLSLYNPTAAPRLAMLRWNAATAVTIRASDVSGRTGAPVDPALTVPAFGRRFVRVDVTPARKPSQ
jgi:alpha-mannosidase